MVSLEQFFSISKYSRNSSINLCRAESSIVIFCDVTRNLSTSFSLLTPINLVAIIAICMSIEQGPKQNFEMETLTEDQADLSRELFTRQFSIRYLYFQEFGESSILFQTDLV